MQFKIIITLFIGLQLIACKGQETKIKSLSATDFEQKLNASEGQQLLDVRTPSEYKAQHLDNAINIDWNSSDFDAQVSQLDKSKPVYVYCLSGGRSQRAATKLTALGFSEIYELKGGIMKWNAAGLSKKTAGQIGMTMTDYKKLLKSDKKVLVNFYADWCAPCRKMAPYINKMQADTTADVVLLRLNADEHKSLLVEMKIDELPTMLLYDSEKLMWQHSGYISETDLKKQL